MALKPLKDRVVVALEKVVKEGGDGEGADAAGDGGDGGEVGASANFVCDVAF